MLTDYGGYRMDVRTYTMILISKLWGLSWAYRDGDPENTNLTKDQQQRKVVSLPSLLQFTAYVYFAPACACGPSFEYYDF